MKNFNHFLSLSLLIFIIELIMVNSSLADEWWQSQIRPPCWSGPNRNEGNPPVWSEQKEFHICVRDYPNDFQSCFPADTDCCYTIVYYDGIQLPDSLPDNLYVYIGGIIWDGNNCAGCNQTEIEQVFYRELMKQELQNGFGSPPPDTSIQISYLVHLLTPGSCKNTQNEICNTFCCITDENVFVYWTNENTWQIDSITYGDSHPWFPVNCPVLDSNHHTICTPFCHDYPFHDTTPPPPPPDSIPSLNCDSLPCNTGAWTIITSQPINTPNCPGCQIQITYRMRQHPNCNPPYTDFILDTVTTLNGACDSCVLITADIYQYALDWVVRDGVKSKIRRDSCINSIRVMQASCWGTWIDTIEDRRERQFFACPYSECCTAIYKVCNIGDSVFTTQFISGTSVIDSACIPFTPAPCYFICNVYLSDTLKFEKGGHIIINEEQYVPVEKSIVIPNPSKGEIIIKYNSVTTGNLKLEINNEFGDLILSKSFKKDDMEISVPVSLKELIDGVYYYRIENGNNILNYGMFSIIR